MEGTSQRRSGSFWQGRSVRELLTELVNSQSFAVLASQRRGQPYANLVAFAMTEDLKNLIFATPRATRKFQVLGADPRVAVMIDNRSNRPSDLHDAVAVMVRGVARELADQERERALETYLAKHPSLEGFVTSPSCALIKVRVDHYDIAARFQNVLEYDVTP